MSSAWALVGSLLARTLELCRSSGAHHRPRAGLPEAGFAGGRSAFALASVGGLLRLRWPIKVRSKNANTCLARSLPSAGERRSDHNSTLYRDGKTMIAVFE
jgi:hypothetical protein